MEISKKWRLARGGGWQEVEVSKRWRLARDRGWPKTCRLMTRNKYQKKKIEKLLSEYLATFFLYFYHP